MTTDSFRAFSETYYPNADGTGYWPGPGVKLSDANTLRDCLPKPDFLRVLLIGLTRLLISPLIIYGLRSYQPGPGLCRSPLGTRSYFVASSVLFLSILGVLVLMWQLDGYLPSALIPSIGW